MARRTARDDARELYTQGRYVLTQGQFDPAIHRRALDLFSRSIDRDSTFAPAYAGMADVYNHADEHERAKNAALRAIMLDSTLAEAYHRAIPGGARSGARPRRCAAYARVSVG